MRDSARKPTKRNKPLRNKSIPCDGSDTDGDNDSDSDAVSILGQSGNRQRRNDNSDAEWLDDL